MSEGLSEGPCLILDLKAHCRNQVKARWVGIKRLMDKGGTQDYLIQRQRV